MSKLNLDKLKVQSFVTSLDHQKEETVKGAEKAPSKVGLPQACSGVGQGACTFTCPEHHTAADVDCVTDIIRCPTVGPCGPLDI